MNGLVSRVSGVENCPDLCLFWIFWIAVFGFWVVKLWAM